MDVDRFPPLTLVSQAPSPLPTPSQLPARGPAHSAPYTYKNFPFTYASKFLECSNEHEPASRALPLHNTTVPALAVPAVSVPRVSGLPLHQLLTEMGCYDSHFTSY